MKVTIGSLFSGIGGFELGAQRAFDKAGIEHKILWQCEKDKYCQSILKKHWPNTTIYDDIKKMNKNNTMRPDIMMGGFPCQDISMQNIKGEGIHGKRSSLWFEYRRLISELRPRIAVLENVAALRFRGLREVLGSIAQIGYNAEWQVVSAAQLGAPHKRERIFIVCTPNTGVPRLWNETTLPLQMEKNIMSYSGGRKIDGGNTGNHWEKFNTESPLCRRDDGVSPQLAQLKALGNAIVPQVSEFIFDHIAAMIINQKG